MENRRLQRGRVDWTVVLAVMIVRLNLTMARLCHWEGYFTAIYCCLVALFVVETLYGISLGDFEAGLNTTTF